MSGQRWLLVLLPCVASLMIIHPLDAMTLDYTTSAKALAEVGWYDLWSDSTGALPVGDSNEATNGRSYAEAYWDEFKRAGKLSINIAASVEAEPNQIVLTTDLSGSFQSEAETLFYLYFYQEAQGVVEGSITIDEFPPGRPCSLHFDANWPQDTWTGEYFWQFEATSSFEWVQCGYDPNGPYGPRRGQVTVFAGEPVYFFLGTAAGGLYNVGYGSSLGRGTIRLDLTLKVTPHVADLNADGYVNFKDFARFARQWRRNDPNAVEAAQRAAADFDASGTVGIRDLQWIAHYWLLAPLPPATPPDAKP